MHVCMCVCDFESVRVSLCVFVYVRWSSNSLPIRLSALLIMKGRRSENGCQKEAITMWIVCFNLGFQPAAVKRVQCISEAGGLVKCKMDVYV
jgi:hypothetical protein